MRKMFLLLGMSLISVFLILANASVSMAIVRIELEPGDGGGVPLYANLGAIMSDGSVWTINTDEWAAIPFYHDPDCVPEDFNLALCWDFNAFNCYSYLSFCVVFVKASGTRDWDKHLGSPMLQM